jgi:hypothetical protein
MSMIMVVSVPMSDQLSRHAVRLEDFDGLMIMDAEAVERLAQTRIVRRKQARGLRLDREVKIAHGPADEGGGIGGEIERNLQDGLRRLPDHVLGSGGLPCDVAVAKRRGQLETKIGSIVRRTPPKDFGQLLPVDANRDFFEGLMPGGEGGANEKHAKKKQVIFQMSRANCAGGGKNLTVRSLMAIAFWLGYLET